MEVEPASDLLDAPAEARVVWHVASSLANDEAGRASECNGLHRSQELGPELPLLRVDNRAPKGPARRDQISVFVVGIDMRREKDAKILIV
jgi:hypothetical protein